MVRRLLPGNLIHIAADSRVCGLLIVVLVLAALHCFAQIENGRSVEGRVLTTSNKIIAGAVVQIKDTKSLQIRSFITQADGRYRFYGLNLNSDYELTAEKNGATSGIKTLSMFDNRKKAVIDLKMKKNPDSK